jgi:Mg2+/Co2+ transporter CorB
MMAINRYRLKVLAKTNKNAKRTERLLENLDHLIGTILLGNNLVNIFAASIATILAIKLWGEGSVILASLALTFIILVFAETTPKTCNFTICSIFSNSGHVGWCTASPDIILKLDTLVMIQTKFG